MIRSSRAGLLLACLFLAGCWQSQHGALYGKIATVAPFRSGTLIATGGDKPEGFTILARPDGGYSLIGAEKDEKGLSDGFNLRFFAIPGLPKDLLAYEAVSISHCTSKFACDAVAETDDRYYGLMRPNRNGAAELRPDCQKDAAFIDKAKVKIDDGVCTFTDRATLETALRALAASNRKPDRIYRYR
jgi:hypothetical protein